LRLRLVSDKPLAFAALAAIYSRYRVNRVRVDVTFSGADSPMWTALAVVGPSSTFTTASENVNDMGRNPFVYLDKVEHQTLGTPQCYRRVQHEFSIAQIMGYTQREYDAQMTLTGTNTTSPSGGFIPYMLLNVANRGASAAASIRVEVRLIFDCTWFEPTPLIV
jgi:hypothetical protein